VPARVLGVVGDLLEDVVIHVAAAPARGTDTPARISRRRGGSAANVAAAAARAGGAVRFIGRVGTDTLGELLVAALSADGVDVRVQRGGRTGTVAVLVEPGGERTMLPDRGAAAELEAIDPAWLSDLGWLHLTAYSLCGEPAGSAAREAARQVRGAGGRVSVDISSVAVVEAFGRSRFGDLLDQLAPDVVFANTDEARTLVGRPPGVLVVKDGPRPVVVTEPDGRTVEVAVPSIGSVADTTGAGDAFAAGFLVAALEGSPADVAARSGVALAVRALGRVRE
jgi:sugar/nucleoside kinase (ribokinase family)